MKLSEQVLQLALERAHVLQKWEGGDKNDQVRGLLWHKTRTTIVIKLTLETLAKPVKPSASSSAKLPGTGDDGCVCWEDFKLVV